jgi:hypothetical protein
MKTRASELCASCRDLRTPSGMRLGDFIDAAHNNEQLKNMDDNKFNAAILSVLHDYPDQHCTKCYGLVLSRAR